MELNRDDEKARRICSLALEFMNAGTPLTSSQIARDFYPELGQDSFRKAFSRDRDTLRACGIVVVEKPQAGSESLWEADEGLSFAEGAEIGAQDAAVLDLALRPLLFEPGFAFAEDLRFALAKIRRAFAEADGSPVKALAHEPRALAALRSCSVAGTSAQVTYTDAAGYTRERVIAPWGFFDLRGTIYLVAPRVEGGQAVEGSMRVYNVDRFDQVRPRAGERVPAPADFNAEDWRVLPFQIGPKVGDAEFLVPDDVVSDVRRACRGQAETVSREEGQVLLAWMADTGAAASWAIACGVRPIAPAELVEAWRHALEEVVRHG